MINSEGNQAKDVHVDDIKLTIQDPQGKHVNATLVPQRDVPSKIDVTIIPSVTGQHTARIEVMNILIDNGAMFDVQFRKDIAILRKPDTDPFKTQASVLGQSYVGRRCIVLTLQFDTSDGILSTGFQEDDIMVMIQDTLGNLVDSSLVRRLIFLSEINAIFFPTMTGLQKVCIKVKGRRIDVGETTFEVKGILVLTLF